METHQLVDLDRDMEEEKELMKMRKEDIMADKLEEIHLQQVLKTNLPKEVNSIEAPVTRLEVQQIQSKVLFDLKFVKKQLKFLLKCFNKVEPLKLMKTKDEDFSV